MLELPLLLLLETVVPPACSVEPLLYNHWTGVGGGGSGALFMLPLMPLYRESKDGGGLTIPPPLLDDEQVVGGGF